MLAMEKIPNQIGYLILTEDGAVLSSGGDLKNDERVADIVTNMISLSDKIDAKAFPSNPEFEKLTITFEDHCYVICLSNKKIYVVKKRLESEVSTQNLISV